MASRYVYQPSRYAYQWPVGDRIDNARIVAMRTSQPLFEHSRSRSAYCSIDLPGRERSGRGSSALDSRLWTAGGPSTLLQEKPHDLH